VSGLASRGNLSHAQIQRSNYTTPAFPLAALTCAIGAEPLGRGKTLQFDLFRLLRDQFIGAAWMTISPPQKFAL